MILRELLKLLETNEIKNYNAWTSAILKKYPTAKISDIRGGLNKTEPNDSKDAYVTGNGEIAKVNGKVVGHWSDDNEFGVVFDKPQS